MYEYLRTNALVHLPVMQYLMTVDAVADEFTGDDPSRKTLNRVLRLTNSLDCDLRQISEKFTTMACLFNDSDEEGEIASDSDDEQGNVAKAEVTALKSKARGLQFFRSGPKVYCPLCPNKEPLKDLQALWQHGAQNKDRWYYRDLHATTHKVNFVETKHSSTRLRQHMTGPNSWPPLFAAA